jgi:hypothetical protein
MLSQRCPGEPQKFQVTIIMAASGMALRSPGSTELKSKDTKLTYAINLQRRPLPALPANQHRPRR